jgi:Uma2 family endonuclease
MPDVQFYRARNPATVGQAKGLEHGRPDLVVEVVSPTSRRYDRVLKVEWYARLGIPEYWIVDPEARTLERLVLRAGAYVHVEGHAEVDTFHPASFRGLSIPLRDLWTTEGHLAGRRPAKGPRKRRKP